MMVFVVLKSFQLISQRKHTSDHMNSDTPIDGSKKKIAGLSPMHLDSYYSGKLMSMCSIALPEV
jgi:hypothetical protein